MFKFISIWIVFYTTDDFVWLGPSEWNIVLLIKFKILNWSFSLYLSQELLLLARK